VRMSDVFAADVVVILGSWSTEFIEVAELLIQFVMWLREIVDLCQARGEC
jgi:hypothetical protein